MAKGTKAKKLRREQWLRLTGLLPPDEREQPPIDQPKDLPVKLNQCSEPGDSSAMPLRQFGGRRGVKEDDISPWQENAIRDMEG